MKNKAFDLDSLIVRGSGWFRSADEDTGIVVSSRARLARNLVDFPFPQHATDEQRARALEEVLHAGRDCESLGSATFLQAGGICPLDRQLLVERHLISPNLAGQDWPCGVLVRQDEAVSVMVNEEDHLRIQSMIAGFRLDEALELANKVDDELAAKLDFAFSARWGYLTACPTNTGTGLRVSVLIHLPGLVLTREIEPVLRGVRQMGCAVRGFYGEGTEIVGNLLQVSNQVTLGPSEVETVGSLREVVEELVRCENKARDAVFRDAREQIEDKVWRAYGILLNSRLLGSQEFMNLASAIRLGLVMRVLEQPSMSVLNELMVLTQPSHLQKLAGRILDPPERDAFRASFVRQRLAGVEKS